SMYVISASDHGRYYLTTASVSHLKEKGIDVKDGGPNATESVDYPDYAKPVATAVQNGEYDRGILVCGTRIGMNISANKYKGIRAALVHDTFSAHATREHNNSNMLNMDERVIGTRLALVIVDILLKTEIVSSRHERRIEKIER